MILGVDQLSELVKNNKLVENLCERELTNPEGCGFDLRLGQVHKIKGKGFLGVTQRSTPDSDLIIEFDEKQTKSIVIKPGESYLVTTIEKVNMPTDLTANMWLRSTMYRSGIILSAGNVSPGYSGVLSFTLYNSNNCEMEIELGARIVHILFYQILGESNSYRGQWQGGRVTTNIKEKQV
jgi:deoxycytidine triphosphate deaminase